MKRDKLKIEESSQAEQDSGDINESRQAEILQKTQKELKPLWIQENILVKQTQSLTPIIQSQILHNIDKLSDADLESHAKALGPILLDLMLCDDYDIRSQNK